MAPDKLLSAAILSSGSNPLGLLAPMRSFFSAKWKIRRESTLRSGTVFVRNLPHLATPKRRALR